MAQQCSKPNHPWPVEPPAGADAFDTSFHTDWLTVRTAASLQSALQQGDCLHSDWLIVQTAARLIPEAAQAMEKLCRTYWFPLYAYVRRRGHSPEDAQDLTQEFFARMLAKPWLQHAHPSKGRFRSFLLAALNHFLANEWRRQATQKRGGGCDVFSLDAVAAEDRYRIEPASGHDPDKVFERHWAMTLLELARTRLGDECAAGGHDRLFAELKPMFDGEENPPSYAEIGGRLGLSETAVKKAAQRLRARFQLLLREEIGRTVSEPSEVEGELRCLFAALQG